MTPRDPNARAGGYLRTHTRPTMRVLALLLFAVSAAAGCRAQSPDPEPTPAPAEAEPVPQSLAPQSARGSIQEFAQDTAVDYVEGRASRDGTGRFYMGREIAQVMSHRGAAWLERADREREERPDALIRALDLAPDAVVTDLGAGTGYFTFRIAERVPRGRVYAVDIQPEMLRILEDRMEAEGVTNVAPILGSIRGPGLRPQSTDLTLLVDAYHEFSHPREMLEAVYESTRPGGRLVLVEYRAEDPDVPIKALHKMTEAQVRREAEASGFRFVENLDVLPQQHLLIFERPAE